MTGKCTATNSWYHSPRPAALLFLVLVAIGREAVAADQGPVALYTPPLTTPIEAAGTGLAPEVAVRIEVDDSGKVSAVQVLQIKPSSDYDRFFEGLTRQTLKRWRYAPARRDGSPVKTELQWTVKFPTREEETDAESSQPWRRLSTAEEDAQNFRERILALPLEQRTKLLEQEARIGRKLLDPKRIKRFNSAHFMVFTDGPGDGLDQALAQNLEATFSVLHDLLGEAIAPQPEPYRVVVFMFATRAAYGRFVSQVHGLEWAAGFYHPVGLLAFHMEMPSNEDLLSVMLHEATHAYLDRYIAKPGVYFPRWLNEGFAEYVGNSQIKKRQLVPGRTRRTAIYNSPWGAVMASSSAQFSLEELKRAIRQEKGLSLQRVLDATVTEFYGAARGMYYTTAWLLVHFLRHAQDGWAIEKFPNLVLYVAEGYPALDAFREVYGEPTQFEESFRRYILKF